MNQFAGVRNAKEFLIAQIAEQAHLEGVPLSETERKMLDFSQTEGTFPERLVPEPDSRRRNEGERKSVRDENLSTIR
jgi:hypothetical protein